MNYDDETLMAYADGELDPVQRAEIAAAEDKDPELARRVEKQRALRAAVAGAFANVVDEPLPARLLAAANGDTAAVSGARAPRSGKIVQFPARAGRAPGPGWGMREWLAMAASVVLGLLISWQLFAPSGAGLMTAKHGALVARGNLANALDKQLASDQRPEEPVQIGVTFKARDGGYCRSFTLRGTKTAGLACRAGGEWQVAATSVADIQAGQVQQAAATLPAAVLSAIETRRVGDALDAAGEENARLGGWDR